MLASLQMVAQRCELSIERGESHFYVNHTVNLRIFNNLTNKYTC